MNKTEDIEFNGKIYTPTEPPYLTADYLQWNGRFYIPKEAETPLDTIEILLSFLEPFSDSLEPDDRKEFQRICAETADARDGTTA